MPPSPVQPDPKEAVEGRLCAYLEGDLSEADRADLDRHLAANPQHRQLLADLAEQRLWLRAVPAEPAPPEVADVYREQVERSMLMGEGERASVRRGGLWPQYAMVAALVLATVGLAIPLVLILSSPGPAHQVAADLPTRPPPTAAGGPAAPSPTVAPAVAPSGVGGQQVTSMGVTSADRSIHPPAAAAPPPPPTESLATEQNTVQNAARNSAANALPNAPVAAADGPPSDTVHLTVVTGDPASADARIRAFATGGHVTLADAPPAPAAASAPAPLGSAMSAGRRSFTAPTPPPASGGGGRPAPAPARYTLTGLTADQARRLAADLSATVDAGRLIRPGETLTVTVAQLAGKAGVTPANAVRVAADGTIALPMLDPVPAAGATTDVLARRVADGYRQAHLIPQPTVTVTGSGEPPSGVAATGQTGMTTGMTVVIDVRAAPALPNR